MYGCMALMTERFEEAETFFEAATCTESKSVVAWTMLGNTQYLLTTVGYTGTYNLLGNVNLHWTRVPVWTGKAIFLIISCLTRAPFSTVIWFVT